jgi:hypothetical protein
MEGWCAVIQNSGRPSMSKRDDDERQPANKRRERQRRLNLPAPTVSVILVAIDGLGAADTDGADEEQAEGDLNPSHARMLSPDGAGVYDIRLSCPT